MAIAQPRKKLFGSTRLLYDELVRKDAQPIVLSASSSLIEYTDTSGAQHLLYSMVSDKTSAIGKVVADSKARTSVIAEHLNIPIPSAIICRTVRDAVNFLSEHEYTVIKPRAGRGGRGVTTRINDEESLRRAYTYAKGYDSKVVAQQHITGADVRLLTIDGKFCSAVIRKPAIVTGDGTSTLKQLIADVNTKSPRNDPNFMSILPINLPAAVRYVGDAIHSVPKSGEKVRTTGPANVSLGGSLHEASHQVTSAMISDAEKISQHLGLGICGVDMMWDQTTGQHYLIEINVSPGIDIHNDPYSGTSSDCVERYADWLMA